MGYGFGQFTNENRPFLTDRSTDLRLESIRGYSHHNTYLSLLVELGLFGLFLYCAILASWWRAARQLWQQQGVPDWKRGYALFLMVMMISYIVQMLFHDVTFSTVENGILFLLGGAVTGFLSESRGGSSVPIVRRQVTSPTNLGGNALPVH